ncbi:unnamed protein product [Pleuronectes platessa]|uniref:Uncharacterized protein n=1 Tax=Pleuronectes platessa TaxID=8262 RepID=A0A9N7YDP3_PLEPL|nr:unnamed protein product [Pleuronectes platessa]
MSADNSQSNPLNDINHQNEPGEKRLVNLLCECEPPCSPVATRRDSRPTLWNQGLTGYDRWALRYQGPVWQPLSPPQTSRLMQIESEPNAAKCTGVNLLLSGIPLLQDQRRRGHLILNSALSNGCSSSHATEEDSDREATELVSRMRRECVDSCDDHRSVVPVTRY